LSKHRVGRRLQAGHKPHQKGRRTKADWCINTFPLQENRTHQEQTKKNRAENEPGQGKTDNEKLIKNRPRPARDNKPKARSENVITLANTLMQRLIYQRKIQTS